MGNESTTITTPTVVRQTQEPQALDGRIWINPSGGDSGNNTERYIYNSGTTAWELDTSIGPDNPTKAIDGSLWQDTSVNPTTTRVYDEGGSSWEKLGLDPGHTNPTYDSGEDGTIDYADNAGNADNLDGNSAGDLTNRLRAYSKSENVPAGNPTHRTDNYNSLYLFSLSFTTGSGGDGITLHYGDGSSQSFLDPGGSITETDNGVLNRDGTAITGVEIHVGDNNGDEQFSYDGVEIN